jgi:membrane fusion protein, multidrug efflux system
MAAFIPSRRLNQSKTSDYSEHATLCTRSDGVAIADGSSQETLLSESQFDLESTVPTHTNSRDHNGNPFKSVSLLSPLTSTKYQLTILGFLALAAAAPACNSASAQPSSSANSAVAVAAAHIGTQAVSARPVQSWLTLTGQLKGSKEADLAANANGRITKTLVERGETVKAGQPLAVIDTRSANLNLAEARASAESAVASAENAKLTCDRYRALAETGAISQFEYDRVSVQCRTSDLGVSAARARAALAGQIVGDGVIRAPFAGSVAERFVDAGEFVHSDTRVVSLVDFSMLRVEFTVPEANIAVVRPGAKIRFSVAGYPTKKFDGTVKYVGAQVRPMTRDVVAEAVVDAPDVVLRPGMFAAVQLAAGAKESSVVPRRSLLERDGKFVAFVEANGRLEERIVQTGEVEGDEVAITRGLSAGEKLVVAPSNELKNGQRIL